MKISTCGQKIITLLIIFLDLTTSAQSWTWSEPQPLTDSLADHRNAQVVMIPFTSGTDHYIFWERSEDANSTAIYYRRFYEQSEPVALLESPGVHFHNPRFISNFWDDDTLFYMFYESDQNGSIDIFYKVYTIQGFGDPVLLAGTPEDDTHFRCAVNRGMVWQEGDRIRFAELLFWNTPFHISDPVTIDSVGCHSPDVTDAYYIAYLKSGADTSAIYYTYRWGSTWVDPILINSPGDNGSLRFAGGTCGDESGLGIPMAVWENVVNGEHAIRAWDLLWAEEFLSEFTQEAPFLPDIALYMIPVDILSESFMTFVNDLEGDGDIMVTDFEFNGISPYLEDYLNLSNSSYIETNPGFFNGGWSEFCYVDLINVWESFRNGHWQLFCSLNSLYCCGGTEETISPRLELQVYPNPVSDECVISYTLDEDTYVTLKVLSINGRQVNLINHEFLVKGEYNYHMDLDQVFSGTMISGMFIVSLETAGGLVSRKVLLTR